MPKKLISAPIYRETDLEITDSNLLLQLLGPNDCNIKLIKKAFKLKIWLRGNLIKMSGPSEGLESTEKVFAELTRLVESGKEIDSFDVEKCIQGIDIIDLPTRQSKNKGVIRTSKKTITAKGLHQSEFIQNIEDNDVIFGIGPAGCHRKGQLVIMYDGTLKAVEDVTVGDKLMGPDSTPRNVLELHTGHEEMVEITPAKGDPWVVNKGHIMTVARTFRNGSSGATKTCEVKDVPLAECQTWPITYKKCHKLFKVAVDFKPTEDTLPTDPYFLGLFLGECSLGLPYKMDPDTISNLQKMKLLDILNQDKFIPNTYKVSSREQRLALLAGLVDTQENLAKKYLEFTHVSKKLIEDVTFVARSLGFSCYPASKVSKAKIKVFGDCYTIAISGSIDEIPLKVKSKPSKQLIEKDPLQPLPISEYIGFKTKNLPPEDYYGFVLDGDHRYLLEDFTVTHNTGKTWVSMAMAIQSLLSGQHRKIILCRPAVEAGEKLGFLPGDLAEKVNPYLRPLYDALGDMVDSEKVAEMIKTGVIEVAPLAFLRGRSLNHAFILLDEAQNTTTEQMKMFLTRMGTGSKMVVTGDSSQVDLELPYYKKNGLDDAVALLETVQGVAVTRFTQQDVVRHPLVQRIVCAYEAREDNKNQENY